MSCASNSTNRFCEQIVFQNIFVIILLLPRIFVKYLLILQRCGVFAEKVEKKKKTELTQILKIGIISNITRWYSPVGRTTDSYSVCHRFESYYHHGCKAFNTKAFFVFRLLNTSITAKKSIPRIRYGFFVYIICASKHTPSTIALCSSGAMRAYSVSGVSP